MFDEFDKFDAAEAFFHEVGRSAVILYGSIEDELSVTYCPASYESDYYYDASEFSPESFLIRVEKLYIRLFRDYFQFKSPKTNGWVLFECRIKLEDLVNVIKSPFELKLPDPNWDNGRLCFDDVIIGENLIIEVDIDKIKRKLRNYECLMYFV